MAEATRKVRRNGFQLPWGLVPVLAWLGQVLAVGVFGMLAAVAVRGDGDLALTVGLVYGVPVLIAAGLWVYCQAADPALPGGCRIKGMEGSQSVARYCSVCRKMVPGLDHHCKWLNTCVGTRTYAQFYLLSLFGWVYPLVQGAFGLYFVVDEGIRVAAEGAAFYVLTAANFGLALGVFSTYMNLFLFHTLLISRGQGTYTYLIEKRNQKLAERDAQRKAAGPAAEAGGQAAAQQHEEP